MNWSPPPTVRRAGLLVVGVILLTTVAMSYQAYVIWQSPPAMFDGAPSIEFDIAVALTELIVLTVGLYLARNAYRWSMADSAD
ncbi:hypothetical protein SAMN04487949_0931 [Halogranum gelatinilyticum]|uniref:Uncharacterized protein n=1 Tax=Halogranum gelatinilyticum TaxID=660521 RepID=A0A1G9QND9_9EURY|nr:hypothetical protein [Halogranum gelatinilyticum]SDM12087.1 hypothetical protein SAMN04487949_0931 [Halogranum gelatinilyticum]